MKSLSKMKTYSRKNSSYLKKAFVASNFNEMCRLCLSEVDMVLTPIIQDNKTSYQEWIQYGVDVMVEEGDGLPPNICEECLAMVEQTFLFKKKCKASDSKLREHLELLELNEEGRISSFDDAAEDHKNLFVKEYPSKNKTDESSSVDSGGTEDQSEQNDSNPSKLSTEALAKTNKVQTTPKEIPLESTNDKECDIIEIDEEVEEEIESEEPKNPKIISKVQRYILKGNKSEDDQEEDLTVCEVVPLDVNSEDDDCKDQNGHISGTRIQEIFQLWNNEEEEEVQENDSEKVIELVKSEKSEKSNEGGMFEVKMEGDQFVPAYQIYGNKYQIAIVEATSQAKTYKCFGCDLEYDSSTELKQHISKEHREVSDAAYCDICGKSFTCTNSLKRHMSVHTGFKPYKCETCGRQFSQGSILKRHILTHEILKPYNCNLCPKGYTQKMNLLAHLKTHGYKTGADSYQCKLCTKSFVHRSGLSRHLKLHKDIRFLCVHCKKSFADASALARHVKTLHQNQI